MGELQKENFGLKLRIYFLENRMKMPLGDNEQNMNEMVCVQFFVLHYIFITGCAVAQHFYGDQPFQWETPKFDPRIS